MNDNKLLILKRLQEYKKFTSDKQFADFLGISPQLLNNWKKRNTFDAEVLVSKFPEVNARFIVTGEGDFLTSEVNKQDVDELKAKINEQAEIIKNQSQLIAMLNQHNNNIV